MNTRKSSIYGENLKNFLTNDLIFHLNNGGFEWQNIETSKRIGVFQLVIFFYTNRRMGN